MSDTRLAVLSALADGTVADHGTGSATGEPPDVGGVPADGSGAVPGPVLADRLGISRAAVWKHVEVLRDEGFEIATENGYRLVSFPALSETSLRYGLDAPFDVEYHDEIESTNRRARALAEDGARDVAVVADRQSAGRGRLDREWDSPAGGIYLSVVCRPDLPMSRAPLYTLGAAVAIARVAADAGLDARIKWPNDVVVPDDATDRGYRKLAGILTEMQGEADLVDWLVVGVGVNARDPGVDGAASLAEAAGEETGGPDRRQFIQAFLRAFDDLRGDPDAILPAWRDRSLTLGQRVRVETPGGTVVGDAIDVEPPGTLVVETDDGVERVTAGDCEHLRPA